MRRLAILTMVILALAFSLAQPRWAQACPS